MLLGGSTTAVLNTAYVLALCGFAVLVAAILWLRLPPALVFIAPLIASLYAIYRDTTSPQGHTHGSEVLAVVLSGVLLLALVTETLRARAERRQRGEEQGAYANGSLRVVSPQAQGLGSPSSLASRDGNHTTGSSHSPSRRAAVARYGAASAAARGSSSRAGTAGPSGGAEGVLRGSSSSYVEAAAGHELVSPSRSHSSGSSAWREPPEALFYQLADLLDLPELRAVRLVGAEWCRLLSMTLTQLAPASLHTPEAAQMSRIFPYLQRLELGNCVLHVTPWKLHRLAKGLKCLRHLALASCGGSGGGGSGGGSSSGPPRGVAPSISDRCCEALLPLAGTLQSLDLSQCVHVGDAGMLALLDMTSLTCLKLGGCLALTDTGLMLAAQQYKLAHLELQWCIKLTNAGLKALASLSRLTHLDISGCPLVSEQGIACLSALTTLRNLHLAGLGYAKPCVTDAALAALAPLGGLTALSLGGAAARQADATVSDAGIAMLVSSFPLLESLALSSLNITNAGMQMLSGLGQLRGLTVHGCGRLTPACLSDMLKGMPQLASLDLSYNANLHVGRMEAEMLLARACTRLRSLAITAQHAATAAPPAQAAAPAPGGMPAAAAGAAAGNVAAAPGHVLQMAQQPLGGTVGGSSTHAGPIVPAPPPAAASNSSSSSAATQLAGVTAGPLDGVCLVSLCHSLPHLTSITVINMAGSLPMGRGSGDGSSTTGADSTSRAGSSSGAGGSGQSTNRSNNSIGSGRDTISSLQGGNEERPSSGSGSRRGPADDGAAAASASVPVPTSASPTSSKISRQPPAPLPLHLTGLTSLDLSRASQLEGYSLACLSHLTALRSLSLSRCSRLQAEGLQHLATLTHLTSLNLSACVQLTDEGLMRAAAACHGLRMLHLANCIALTNAGVACLGALHRLQYVDLGHCTNVTYIDLDAWAHTADDDDASGRTSTFLSPAAQLAAGGTPFAGDVQRQQQAHHHHASPPPQLRIDTLLLGGCAGFTNEALAAVVHHQDAYLVKLDVSHCTLLDDTGCTTLSRATRLTALDLSHCTRVADDTLAALARLPFLTTLKLSGCVRVTDAGVEALTAVHVAAPAGPVAAVSAGHFGGSGGGGGGAHTPAPAGPADPSGSGSSGMGAMSQPGSGAGGAGGSHGPAGGAVQRRTSAAALAAVRSLGPLGGVLLESMAGGASSVGLNGSGLGGAHPSNHQHWSGSGSSSMPAGSSAGSSSAGPSGAAGSSSSGGSSMNSSSSAAVGAHQLPLMQQLGSAAHQRLMQQQQQGPSAQAHQHPQQATHARQLQQLQQRPRQRQLLTLHLDNCMRLTDASLALLAARATSLTSLRLARCPAITDEGVVALSRLVCLSTLSLAHCPAVTQAGLSTLLGITCLASLEY